MALPVPRQIEGRNWKLVPLAFGCDFESSKALVQDGSLYDCMNYEVGSVGYERSQGLLLYGGTYDSPVRDVWYVADVDANVTLTGAFRVGATVTWTGGSGTLVKFTNAGGKRELFLVDVLGTKPNNTGTTVYSSEGETFTLTGTRRGQRLLDATDPLTTNDLAGTVTDYLNEINSIMEELASASSTTWPHIKPLIPGVGKITGGFQFMDSVYAVRDFFSVRFKGAQNKPNIGDEIQIGSFVGTVAGIDLAGNSWERYDPLDLVASGIGFLYLKPKSGDTLSTATYNTEVVDGVDIDNNTQGNTVAVVDGTSTFPLQRQQGLLWKAESKGWKLVDTGYSVRFQDGEQVPNAQINPLYNADNVASLLDTGWLTTNSVVASFSDGPFIAWVNQNNAATEDGTFATCTLLSGERSGILDVRNDLTDAIPASASAILGIEVRVKCQASANNAIRIDRLYVADQGGGALTTFNFQSLQLTKNEHITTTNAFYEFGGQLDLWGFSNKTLEDLKSGNLRFRIGFINDSGSSETVSVDVMQIKVHYVPRGQTLWFYNTLTTTDDAEGDLFAYNILDGDWATNDAFGYMTFHNVSNPENIQGGLEIRTAANGGGDLIGICNAEARYNFLPGEYDMEQEDSQYQTIDTNFYENEEGRAIYGCTGASPSFVFDTDEKFSFTRLPIAPAKDKPRHLSVHNNHLLLSVGSFVLASAPGSPTTFDALNGGTSWSVRDTVVGLVPTSGSATAIICKESTHALVGTNFDLTDGDVQVQNVSPDSGGLEYTVQNVMRPMYVDFNGVSSIETTDQFGDFQTRPFSDSIEGWLKDRIQTLRGNANQDVGVAASTVVRSKGQYRVYFKDGYILNLRVPRNQQDFAKCMLGHYDPLVFSDDYVPSWIDSSVLSTGRERIVMGDHSGRVWIVDGANAIVDDTETKKIPCWFTINPYNGAYPQGSTKVTQVTVMGDFYEAQDMTYQIGDSYFPPSGPEYTKSLGNYTFGPTLEERHSYVTLNTDTFTDGFSFKIKTTMDGSDPHVCHTLLLHSRPKGSDRNSTQYPRG